MSCLIISICVQCVLLACFHLPTTASGVLHTAFNYKKYVRNELLLSPPDASLGSNVLGVSLKLYHIVDVNDQKQTISIKARVIYDWVDRRLAWDHHNESNASVIILDQPLHKVWQPTVKIQQSLAPPTYFTPRYHLIRENGHVYDFNYIIVTVTCKISTRNFPFDKQRCELMFACTTCIREPHLNRKQWLGFHNENTSAYIDSSYSDIDVRNNKFELLEFHMRMAGLRASRREPKPVLIIVMKRRIMYYVFYLVIPSLMITATAFTQFMLPVQSGEKIGVGLTCLLSQTVFLLLLQENVAPDQQNEIPLLARLFGGQAATIMIITGFSALIIHLHYKAYSTENGAPSRFLLAVARLAAIVSCQRNKAKQLKALAAERKHSRKRGRSGSVDDIYGMKTGQGSNSKRRTTLAHFLFLVGNPVLSYPAQTRAAAAAATNPQCTQENGTTNENCREQKREEDRERKVRERAVKREIYMMIADVINWAMLLISFLAFTLFMVVETMR